MKIQEETVEIFGYPVLLGRVPLMLVTLIVWVWMYTVDEDGHRTIV